MASSAASTDSITSLSIDGRPTVTRAPAALARLKRAKNRVRTTLVPGGGQSRVAAALRIAAALPEDGLVAPGPTLACKSRSDAQRRANQRR